MKLSVSSEIKTNELIRQFSEIYPYLRLEIYHKGREMGDAAHQANLSDIINNKTFENFEIIPEMTVAEVETSFWEKMGIQISIFRKSGRTWLESSYTNYWSLEKQNNLGKELNDFMNVPPQKFKS